jgi:acetyltransferase-like isoleucine patch superfamily enzyme
MHFAMVNANAKIGTGCIINTHSNIEHDAVVGDYCHISTGAMVNGGCIVGNDVFLGSQSVMANGTLICDGCVIGAGSLVRKSFRVKGIYSGNPAILKIKAK